jgi:hypothetical protein
VRRVKINGKRALIAYDQKDLPCESPTEAQLAALTNDMFWLEYGEEMPAVLLARPLTDALN